MTESISMAFAYDDGDIDTNRTENPSLNAMIDARYSRREALRSGVSAAAVAVLGTSALAACSTAPVVPTVDDPRPVVTFGSSGATSAGRTVTLTGTATDNNGVASQSVIQVSGPAVTLIPGATPNVFTFLAPAVAAATPLVFRFQATDVGGQSTSADTTVMVSPAQLGFTAIGRSLADVVTVAAGHTVSVLYRLGDPINTSTPAFRGDGTDAGYSGRAGDHHDGIYFYGLNSAGAARDDNSNTRGLLVMNHENINEQYLHVNGQTNVGGVRPESEALIEMECHGLSIIEVSRSAAGAWSYTVGSTFNRRITPLTPMVFNGPAAGNVALRTVFSPTGTTGRGTLNNCANGFTPWGTNLTCEENWAGYFRRTPATDNPNRSAREVTALTRAGVTSNNGNFGWSTVVAASASNTIFRRHDARVSGASALADFRNEPNQFGWVVEIDPYDPTAAPRKRTALGRFNHEGAWPGNFVAGRRPAWYMGDDAQNEYLYKFVSATPWVPADAQSANRLSIGDRYLDAGTLFVAIFNPDGTGRWAPLVFGTGPLTSANTTYAFADQADVLINPRLAADALGATRMDRPEWTAVNPVTGEMYLTLTNNASRRPTNTDAANPRAYVDPPSTAVGNRNGHILRLRETGDTTEATTFVWDIYVFASGSDLDPVNINLSGLDTTNDFSSPDGLWFGRPSNAMGQINPFLWIQTDDGAFRDVTNNQMLLAIPGTVNDGAVRTISNAPGTTQSTRVGRAPGTQLRRFLVGPVDCEITGIDSTPDGRTLFVNIQHPGENGTVTSLTSSWPATQATGTAPAGTRPRSATIVITRNDNGIVGL
ncbi:MAG: phosphatase [Sphingomonas sp.]|nr:phosphatase [Sphingomonas sp.]